MSSVEERNALWEGLAARAMRSKRLSQTGTRARDEAKLALDAAQADLKQHLADFARAPEAAAPAAPATLTGQVYPYPNYDETQAQPGGGLFPMPFVGVCLSGGGSRSAAASMGALRALRATGLLEKVTFLSTVSGGGWAGVPYTFCPAQSPTTTCSGRVHWLTNGDGGNQPVVIAAVPFTSATPCALPAATAAIESTPSQPRGPYGGGLVKRVRALHVCPMPTTGSVGHFSRTQRGLE